MFISFLRRLQERDFSATHLLSTSKVIFLLLRLCLTNYFIAGVKSSLLIKILYFLWHHVYLLSYIVMFTLPYAPINSTFKECSPNGLTARTRMLNTFPVVLSSRVYVSWRCSKSISHKLGWERMHFYITFWCMWHETQAVSK